MSTKVTKVTIVKRVICSIIILLVFLYILGTAVEDTRRAVREEIIKELEVWYDNYPSLFCPSRWQVIEAIEKVEL